MMNKASILLRVSSVSSKKDIEDQKQGRQEELLQKKDCIAELEKLGVELFKIYREKGSAYKNQFEDRKVLQKLLHEGKENNVKYMIVFDMDRYSRLDPEIVLPYTDYISKEFGIKIHTAHGDIWSELVATVSNFKELGHIGEALGEFLEKILKGLEHRRAHLESVAKSRHTRKAVVIDKKGVTKSYKGNKWGKKRKVNYNKILRLKKENPKMSVNAIAKTLKCNKGSVSYALKRYGDKI